MFPARGYEVVDETYTFAQDSFSRKRVHVLSGGRGIFTPIRLDKGVNAAVFLGAGEVLASGYLWKENREQIASKPLAVVQKRERGLVIGITADPNYRGFTDGASLLFLNAVFRGPSHAGSLPSDE